MSDVIKANFCGTPPHRARRWIALLVTLTAIAAGCSDRRGPIDPTPKPDPLTLACPADVVLRAPQGATSAVVDYAAPTVSGGVPPIDTTCTPRSGSSFSVGTTPVQCRAADVSSAVTCAFSVTVEPPPPPPRLSVTTLLAFGDSLTEGKLSLALAPWMLIESGSAYTLKLQALLQQRYVDQAMTVINEGRGGEAARDAIPRLDVTLDHYRPEVLLLMEGANDLGQGQGAITPAIDALDTMIRDALSRRVKVMLATLPPEVPDRPRSAGEPYVVPFNDRVRALARARDVPLVDVYAAFNGDLSLVGSDGLHLTDRGYEVVARAFYDKIVETLEVRTTSARR